MPWPLRWWPLCPEEACGLGTPRPAMRLEGDPRNPRMISIESGHDRTGQMERWLPGALDELEKAELDGFLLKARSPSCGLADVPRYRQGLLQAHDAMGLFAAALKRRFPLIPLAQETILADQESWNLFLAQCRNRHCNRRFR